MSSDGLTELADRIDAWSNLVSAGYEVPAAGKVMNEAASALRTLSSQEKQEPVAWGRVIGGKAITISRERTPANDTPLYTAPQKPQPAAGWDIPDRITPELACIMENCGEPEMQTGEAVAALVRGYQPTWTKIVAALTNQPLATNASAEARLREALGDLLNCVDGQHDYEWLAGCKEKARKALSAPHTSDCDKQETTKSEGGVEGHARSTKADSVRGEAGSAPSQDGSLAQLAAGIESGPSDRTADVTWGELHAFILKHGDEWEDEGVAARALLDAFTVGKRLSDKQGER